LAGVWNLEFPSPENQINTGMVCLREGKGMARKPNFYRNMVLYKSGYVDFKYVHGI